MNQMSESRTCALIIPREHGAWGLLLFPLFTGVIAGITSIQQVLPALLLLVDAVSLFCLRTPVEALIGTGTVRAYTPRERQTAFRASILFAAASVICLMLLIWRGRNPKLLLIGAVAALAFLLQVILRKFGRKLRMAAQLVGAIGLTTTAPAAYYLTAGHLGSRAFVLWMANGLFASNQIQFVQLCIHAARSATFPQRLARGWLFFFIQSMALLILGFAALWGAVPSLAAIAFVPAFVRGTTWFGRQSEPLDIKRLGWSETKHGIVFGLLLAMSFHFS